MKKLIVTLMLCLVSICGFGQKTFSSKNFVTETVDEFGDNTGNIKVGIHAEGYFSNSATSNSCAELIISFMENSSWASLYEYCGNHSSDDMFYIIAAGTTTNEAVTLDSRRIDYSFVELCKNNDTIKIKMIADSKYSSSTTAVFKLYNCKDFYSKYINEFGKTNYISYYMYENFLIIFSSPVVERYSISFFDYFGLTFDKKEKTIRISGKTKNGKYIFTVYTYKVYIDGIEIKDCGKYSFPTEPDFNSFMNAIKPGCTVSICYERTHETASFILTQEQYNAIIEFYQESH